MHFQKGMEIAWRISRWATKASQELGNRLYNRGLQSSNCSACWREFTEAYVEEGISERQGRKRGFTVLERPRWLGLKLRSHSFNTGINWPFSAGLTVALHFLDDVLYNLQKTSRNLAFRHTCMAETKKMLHMDPLATDRMINSETDTEPGTLAGKCLNRCSLLFLVTPWKPWGKRSLNGFVCTWKWY